MRKQTVCILLLLALLFCGCGKEAATPDPEPIPVPVSTPEPILPAEQTAVPEITEAPAPEEEPETEEAREVVTSAEYSFRAVVFHPAEGCETLAEYGYDYEMYILITRLQDGRVQLYRGVPSALWKEFSAAEDPEAFLREQISGNYECADYIE